MTDWLKTVAQVEALEDVPLDAALVARMQRRYGALAGAHVGTTHFYTPTFKAYASSEIEACGGSAWPAVSITGGGCALQCDHCKAKVLEPMIAARTPADLERVVDAQVARGARGMLLTGGSNRRNEVEYGPYYAVIRRIKDHHPDFRIAIHTALVDRRAAGQMEQAGIDAAMLDVIGAQDTVRQVYHLKRPVADFEDSLEHLVGTSMKVVPHIVLGLHYGQMLGEWNALDMVRRHRPAALVLVVIMPFYAPAHRPFAVPSPDQVGGFFIDARAALPDLPIMLGCARPAGRAKQQIDAYAVLAGLNGLAHPAEGAVELAARLGREVRVSAACCSIAVGDEVLASEADEGVRVDIRRLLLDARAARDRARLGGIPVVSA